MSDIVTDKAKIQETLDGMPAITPDIVLCPRCHCKQKTVLSDGVTYHCHMCNTVFTATMAIQQEEDTDHE